MPNALELRGLHKRYDDGTLALDALDLELRHELWRYIRRLHERGTTILLTTHYLEEAEALCEEIALIGGGRIMARDTSDGLKRRFDAASLEDVYMKTVAAGRRVVEEA